MCSIGRVAQWVQKEEVALALLPAAEGVSAGAKLLQRCPQRLCMQHQVSVAELSLESAEEARVRLVGEVHQRHAGQLLQARKRKMA